MSEAEIRSQPYSLSRADYVHYYLSTYFRTFITLPWGPVSALMPIAVATLLAYDALSGGHYTTAALTGLAFVALWVVIIPGVGLMTMLRNLARTQNSYITRTAVAGGPDFRLESPGFTNRQAWSQFRRVRTTRRSIYLVLANRTTMIVQKSAFASPAECEAFIATCRRQIAGSRDRHARVFDAPMVLAPLPDSQETPPHRIGFRLFAVLYLLAILRIFTRPTTLIGLLAGFVGVPAWINRARIAAGDWSLLWPSLGAVVIFYIAMPPLLLVFSWLTSRNKPVLRNPRRLAITPEQVRLYGEGFDVSVAWPSIRRINRRFGALQFWTGPASAFAVPLSAFPSRDAAQAFQDQATAYWRAKSPPPR